VIKPRLGVHIELKFQLFMPECCEL